MIIQVKDLALKLAHRNFSDVLAVIFQMGIVIFSFCYTNFQTYSEEENTSYASKFQRQLGVLKLVLKKHG